ncbi:MAG: hypothetical protein Q8K89_10335 [Actinomycetota bacterium]|nr:hypothetical protein [Actinomycetota bacterium]
MRDNPELAIALVGWLLTLLVAVVGWLVAAAISASSRRKSFLLEVTEHARREVIPPVAAYQDWISSVAVALSGISWLKVAAESPAFPPDYVRQQWWKQSESLHEVLSGSREALRMFGMLEDYEAVFPQTRQIRVELAGFHQCLSAFAYDAHSRLLGAVPIGYPESGEPLDLDWLEDLKKGIDAFYDMQAITQDIRIGLQNAALSALFKNEVPPRQPLDESVPLLLTSGNAWRLQNALPELPVITKSADAPD